MPVPLIPRIVAAVMGGGTTLAAVSAAGTAVLGFLPVVPLTIVSAFLTYVAWRITAASLPAAATLAKYEV